MALTLPSLVQRITVDTSGIRRGQAETERSTGIMSRGFGGLTKVVGLLGGAIGVIGVGEFFKNSIEEARAAERSQRLIASAIQHTGDVSNTSVEGIEHQATSLSVLDGVSKANILSSDQLLLRFTNIRNEAGKGNDVFNRTAAIIQDVTAATGKGLTPVTIALGKAMNDPVKGMTALTRIGIQFTDQQKKQIKALVDSGNLLGAQRALLDSVGARFAGAAAAAADPMQRFHAVLQNVEEEAGKHLIPILNTVVTFLLGPVAHGVSVAAHEVGFLVDVFKAGFSGKGEFSDASGIIAVVGHIGQAIRGVIDIFQGNAFGAGANIGTALGLSPQAVATIVQTVGVLVAIVRRMGQVFQTDVLPVLERVGNFIESHMRAVLIGLGVALAVLFAPLDLLSVALVFLYVRFQVVRDVVAAVVGFFLNDVVPAVTTFVAGLIGVFSSLVGWFETEWPKISEAVGHIVVVITVVLRIIAAVIGAFIVIAVAAWNTFGSQIISAVEIAFNLIRAIIADALATISGVINLVLDLINGDWGKAWNDIRGLVATAWRLIGQIVQAAIRLVFDIIAGVLVTIRALWGAAWSAIASVLGGIWSRITSTVSGAISSIVGFFASLPGRILGFVGAITAAATSFGSGILHGILSGIGSAAGAVGGFVTDIGNALKNAINRFVIDPLKNFHFTIGALGFHHTFQPFGSLPTLDKGGIIPGPFGAPVPMIGHGGEFVVGLDAMRQLQKLTTVPFVPPAPKPTDTQEPGDTFVFNVETQTFDEASVRRMQQRARMLRKKK